MGSMGMQMIGSALALFGWTGAIIVCALPMWRVSAFIGNNIVTSQTIWEGIWMSCVVQSTGQMQCKVYDSMLALGTDLQGARALMVVSIITGVVGLLISFAGGKCTNIIIRNFYSPLLIDAQKRELGASLYIGWGAGGLLVLGGGLLCANCPPKEEEAPSVKYLINKSTGGYSRGDPDTPAQSVTPPKTYI
ncbi:claudin-4-like [Scomber japonicus]|uniref:claudin-4-like n=1 Tax=Scomber japonicus TaxID=13676 RepID=UPI002305B366|nr:claudin-4-like [Scomber japonicus]